MQSNYFSVIHSLCSKSWVIGKTGCSISSLCEWCVCVCVFFCASISPAVAGVFRHPPLAGWGEGVKRPPVDNSTTNNRSDTGEAANESS